MAVNFGSGNTSRRYTVPDNAAFVLPGAGSWTWLVVFKPDYANTDAKYIISTNNASVANSYNMLLASGSVGNFGAVINTDAIKLTSTPPAVGGNYLGYSRNISGTVRHGYYNLSDQTNFHSATGTQSDSDGTSLVFGARADFDSFRHYRGSISWIALLNKGLSDTELANLAAGTDILMSVHSANVVALWDMSTSSASTITDIVGGYVATKSGTGYGADEPDVLPFSAGSPVPVSFSGTVPTLNGTVDAAFSESLTSYFSGTETPFTYTLQSGTLPDGLSLSSAGVISGTPTTAGMYSGIVVRATDTALDIDDTNSFSIDIAAAVTPVKGIRLNLYDSSNSPLANLSNCQIAWFDQPEPKDFTSVVYKSGIESTDASGVLEIDLDSATSLSINQDGFLLLYNLDAIDHRDSLVFAGKIPVINIAQ